MAGKLIGSIEHLLPTGFSTGSIQSVFLEVYNFFNNNTGTMGFQRIAYHTGANGTGMATVRGMNFFDQPNPAGENAWACFASTSASVPWYVLFQWVGAGSFGAAPGNPGLSNSNAADTNVVGFQFAIRADGGNPWNGSSGSNGSDTKGTSVWTAGTSSLCVFPRSNTAGGAHASLRQNMMTFAVVSNATYRFSMVGDLDNFCLFVDNAVDSTYDRGIVFGKYDPLSGSNPDAPYFAYVNNLALQPANTTIFGAKDGTAPGGGAAFPSLSASGSVGLSLDRLSTTYFQNNNYQPNRIFQVPRFDEMPLFIVANEIPALGYLGQHSSFFREVYFLAIHDTNGDGSRAVFGSAISLYNVKLTIPWHTGTVPGSGLAREGIKFSVP